VVLVQLQTETGKLQKSNEGLGFHLGTMINAIQQQFATAQLPRVANTGGKQGYEHELIDALFLTDYPLQTLTRS
jgi:hypothetical protein